MKKPPNTGRDPGPKEWDEAERITRLRRMQQKEHPSAVKADQAKLDHINSYAALPDFYIDRPFLCRTCGRRQIWRARDQKWYYEEAKAHIDAVAVECYVCRAAKKGGDDKRQG
ncbi:MAG: zinc-ribbon domain containing protein [Gammaproteobacteria bacterium]